MPLFKTTDDGWKQMAWRRKNFCPDGSRHYFVSESYSNLGFLSGSAGIKYTCTKCGYTYCDARVVS